MWISQSETLRLYHRISWDNQTHTINIKNIKNAIVPMNRYWKQDHCYPIYTKHKSLCRGFILQIVAFTPHIGDLLANMAEFSACITSDYKVRVSLWFDLKFLWTTQNTQKVYSLFILNKDSSSLLQKRITHTHFWIIYIMNIPIQENPSLPCSSQNLPSSSSTSWGYTNLNCHIDQQDSHFHL